MTFGIEKRISKGHKANSLEKKIKGENAYHDKSKVRYLKMLKSGTPLRNSKGKITREAEYASTKQDSDVVRIEPNRRWFGNTRTINQDNLDKLREELDKKTRDPYQVLLRLNKLPMSLLTDHKEKSKMNLLKVEGFSETFGKNSSRRRPKLSVTNLEELAKFVDNSYEESVDNVNVTDNEESYIVDPMYKKGQSKRLWSELYKVLDSSDVIVHVLDARDPLGTRCKRIEHFVIEEAKHKHLVFLINKCDLVPPAVASKWVNHLSKEYPTIAYRASLTHVFGKAALINLLRQYSKLHPERKQISVGFVGYPNTGKSSVINSLKRKQVCPVAPIPGQTKVWQYVALMKRIYLIDCPGVVPTTTGSDLGTELVLKGALRVENIEEAEDHIPTVLENVKVVHLCKTYNIEEGWRDSIDFLTRIAKKSGRLLKGGEPDISTVAKMVLNDYVRGNLPHFKEPPQ